MGADLVQGKISVIIPACNEGEELNLTVESLIESEKAFGEVSEETLEIIIIANGSPKVPKNLPDTPIVKLHHFVDQLGVAGGRNLGCRLASGDYFIIVDSHMRFEPKALRLLATTSEEKQAWCCGQVYSLKADGSRGTACVSGAIPRFHFDRYMGYKYKNLGTGVIEAPFITGAFFCVPKNVFNHWGYWQNTAGKWGYSEEGLAIKNYFLGKKMYYNTDAIGNHKYRASNPYPVSSQDRWWNATQTHFIYFDDDTFNDYWLPIFKPRCNPIAIQKILNDEENQKAHQEFLSLKTKTDKQFFNEYLSTHAQ